MALSRFVFPTKHQGQTVSELTSISISFFPLLESAIFPTNYTKKPSIQTMISKETSI